MTYILKYLVAGYKIPFADKTKMYFPIPDVYVRNNKVFFYYKDKAYLFHKNESIGKIPMISKYTNKRYNILYFPVDNIKEGLFPEYGSSI